MNLVRELSSYLNLTLIIKLSKVEPKIPLDLVEKYGIEYEFELKSSEMIPFELVLFSKLWTWNIFV